LGGGGAGSAAAPSGPLQEILEQRCHVFVSGMHKETEWGLFLVPTYKLVR
jgi:hypothetical protein